MKIGYKGILFGALAGTIAGTLGVVANHNRRAIMTQARSWARRTRGARALDNSSIPSFSKGALTGVLIGAAAAMLLAPQSGRDLRRNITKQYRSVAGKTQDFVDFLSYRLNHHQPAAIKKIAKAVKRTKKRAKAYINGA